MIQSLGGCVGRATVVSVDADAVVRRRLAEAGISCGAELEVLGRTAGGGRLVAVGETRMALGAELAESIRLRCDG